MKDSNKAKVMRHIQVVVCLVSSLYMLSCNDDDIPEVYQPQSLPAMRQINYIQNKDSSIYLFDQSMQLTSGRCNTMGFSGKELFTMEYSAAGYLSGAEYTIQASRNNLYLVSYSLNDRNMLSKVTREERSETISLGYDGDYRLTQVTVNTETGAMTRYTIEYDGSNNVASVEKFMAYPSDSYTKWEFGDYDVHNNPFRFLVNVFFAPAFSSAYGPVRYDNDSNINFAMLLSRNNPGGAIEYRKDTEGNYLATGVTQEYNYDYNDDKYPVAISGGITLNIEYIK